MLENLIKQKSSFKINYSLKRLRKNFHLKKIFKSVIVGGTNGKGSVCLILEKLLRIKGIKTGVYLSPHIFDYNERFRINGRAVSKAKLKQIINSRFFLKADITEFELLTLAAIKLFNAEKIQWGVFEVGMGGRYDATRIINHDAAVLTTVSFDHTEYLGKTLKEILSDKIHIFRNTPVCVSGKIKGSLPLKTYVLNKDFYLKDGKVIINKKEYFLPPFLNHSFQKRNYALALFCLIKSGFKFTDNELVRLKNFYPQNKFFIKKHKGVKVFLTPAHNVQAVKETVKSLKNKNIKKVLFFCFKDKNYRKMFALLKENFKTVIYVNLENPRSLDIKKLKPLNLKVKDLNKAIKDLKENTLVAGSHLIVRKALAILKK